MLEERQIITAVKVQRECPIVLLVKLGSEEGEEKCTVKLCKRENELGAVFNFIEIVIGGRVRLHYGGIMISWEGWI